AVVEQYVLLEPLALQAYESSAAPIVLLPPRDDTAAKTSRPLAPEVAPGQRTLGFVRPYTPLHILMLKRVDRPIVCTSGNLSDEPQCIDNTDARDRLSSVADWFLIHERPIHHRIDDSVVRVAAGQVRTVRRARGLAPAAIPLPAGLEKTPSVLACGGHLKATFALTQAGAAVVSPHTGDLDHLSAFEAYVQSFELLSTLYGHQPTAVAVDAHPEYRSTRWGRALAAQRDWQIVEVQHHHAHIAATMAEHGYSNASPPVLGIALDGLGMGIDRTIWGGEFLLATYADFVRVGTFKPVPMIGGEVAAVQPWRSLLAHLRAIMSEAELNTNFGELPVVKDLLDRATPLLEQARADTALSPLASSAGRLFDAVSAAVGVCTTTQAYEGQAAIELEAVMSSEDLASARVEERYPIGIPQHPELKIPYLEFRGLWSAILGDLFASVSPSRISARFHVALAEALVRVAQMVRSRKQRDYETGSHDPHGNPHRQHPFTVALGGGCFQNRVLLTLTVEGLEAAGFRVLAPSRFPANDGCIALGQAAIAAARLTR
ncbi:MAG: Sua5/YciO/YrdC/YwlC family protein, partial [Myxococcota bacterium]